MLSDELKNMLHVYRLINQANSDIAAMYANQLAIGLNFEIMQSNDDKICIHYSDKFIQSKLLNNNNYN